MEKKEIDRNKSSQSERVKARQESTDKSIRVMKKTQKDEDP